MATAPAFRSAGAKVTSTTTTSLSVGAPASVVANDVVLLFVENDYSAGSAPTITPPVGFALFATADDTTNKRRVLTYWLRATGAQSTYAVTSTSTWLGAGVVAYSGCTTVGVPFAAATTAVKTTSSTTTPAVSLTPPSDACTVVWAGWNDSYGSWTAPSGYTKRLDTSTTGGQAIAELAQTALTAQTSITGTCGTAGVPSLATILALIPPVEPGRHLMAAG